MKARLIFATLLLAALTCHAHATEAARIHVSQAWIRVLPGDLPAAGYAVLENTGDQPATLGSISSNTYAEVMLHLSDIQGGMNSMTMLDNLALPAHAKVTLAPGGYHLMLMKAHVPVTPGNKVKLTLHFADGSTLDADFMARPANAIGL